MIRRDTRVISEHMPVCLSPRFTNSSSRISRYLPTSRLASVVMSLAYGHKEPVHYQDPEIQAIELDGHRIGLTLRPGAWKVESLPFLQYVPGYMSTLTQWHKEELELFMGGCIHPFKGRRAILMRKGRDGHGRVGQMISAREKLVRLKPVHVSLDSK